MITDFNQLDLSRQYTYADYLTWHFKDRVELLYGWVARKGFGEPTRHQLISGQLLHQLYLFEQSGGATAYRAPFDVVLPFGAATPEESHTVVQPDICVIADPGKLNERGAFGAPDWIIEILAPGNARKEARTKMTLYAEASVREYWLVDCSHYLTTVFDLQNGAYQFRKIYSYDEEIPSSVFPDCRLNLEEIFAVFIADDLSEEAAYEARVVRI